MELFLASFIIGVGMGLVVREIAKFKGYQQLFGWFFYGFMIWPVALIHSLVLENRKVTINEHKTPKDITQETKNSVEEKQVSRKIILPESYRLQEEKMRAKSTKMEGNREELEKAVEARQDAHDKSTKFVIVMITLLGLFILFLFLYSRWL